MIAQKQQPVADLKGLRRLSPPQNKHERAQNERHHTLELAGSQHFGAGPEETATRAQTKKMNQAANILYKSTDLSPCRNSGGFEVCARLGHP